MTDQDILGKLEALADDLEAEANVLATGAALEGGDANRLVEVKAQITRALEELNTLAAGEASITDE